MVLTEPTTPTGQAYMAEPWVGSREQLRDLLLAIEQEAAAHERARLRQAVSGLPATDCDDGWLIDRESVLWLLDPDPDPVDHLRREGRL